MSVKWIKLFGLLQIVKIFHAQNGLFDVGVGGLPHRWELEGNTELILHDPGKVLIVFWFQQPSTVRCFTWAMVTVEHSRICLSVSLCLASRQVMFVGGDRQLKLSNIAHRCMVLLRYTALHTQSAFPPARTESCCSGGILISQNIRAWLSKTSKADSC